MQNPILTDSEWMKCSLFLSAAIGRPIPANQLEAYYDMLNDIPFETLKGACKRAIQEQKDNWLPSVGAIRLYAAEFRNGQLPQYTDEWDQVRKAIKRFGWPQPVKGMASLSPLAQRAVKAIGGWMAICDAENPSITGAQFRAAYESLAKREENNRRISPELRPVITSGPTLTPRIHDERRDEIRNIVDDAARKLKSPEDPAA